MHRCHLTLATLAVAALLLPATSRAAFRPVEGGIEFSLERPGASSVALAGDFNGWDTAATPMADPDGDGTWVVVVDLEPGRHEYKFVVDGSTWVNDPDNPLTGGEYGNSVLELAPGGTVQDPSATRPARPSQPSGTPSASNTPVNSRVYIGGWFRMLMEGRTGADGDARLRLQRPEDQFNLDVTANLNRNLWGSLRLQVETGEGGANELGTELYKAQSNLQTDGFAVKAYYNEEAWASRDVLGLLGTGDLRGTIEVERLPFGQGTQGVVLQTDAWGNDLSLLYSDTYDEDILNPSEPTVLQPRKEGLNQNTGTDMLGLRLSRPWRDGELGLSYRGEYSDWWINFNSQENNTPPELQAHLDADPRAENQKSDNFELANDEHFVALDLAHPLPSGLVGRIAAGWGWYSARWSLGNREDVQGDGAVNGEVDIPVGSENLWRGLAGLDWQREGWSLSAEHEWQHGEGMSAGENRVAYRTTPGPILRDHERFALNGITSRYNDVNGADAVDVVRLGPTPRRFDNTTRVGGEYRAGAFELQLRVERQAEALSYSEFFGGGAAGLDRARTSFAPSIHWRPFDAPRHYLGLVGQVLRHDDPDELALAGFEAEASPQPYQGNGHLLRLQQDELLLVGRLPTGLDIEGTPLDLRLDLRVAEYSSQDGLVDGDGEPVDLGGSFFNAFAALSYYVTESIELQLGYGVDPVYYDVIDARGWPNGRQMFRDQWLVEQRLDPWNPANILRAESELEDRNQVVINALVTF